MVLLMLDRTYLIIWWGCVFTAIAGAALSERHPILGMGMAVGAAIIAAITYFKKHWGEKS